MGLYPRKNKSVTTHIQIIQHLGFVLNFIDMTVFVTDAKITKLTETARIIFSKTVVEILLTAKLIGHMVSCFPAVEFGKLFYRQVEIDMSTSLKAQNTILMLTWHCHTELNLTSNGGYPMHNFLKML